jgi:hypothetical protein
MALSRRDGAIVAWHEVPGTRATQKSRPVGYGLIRAVSMKFEYDNTAHIFDKKYSWDVWENYARSYRTLRDGSLSGRFPRHFVPGYDHAVPLGRDKFSATRL